MRYRLFAPLLAFAFVAFVGLLGCGGVEGGCSGSGARPNGAYAGAYTATFTPNSGSASALNPLTFTLTVSGEGLVTGTVLDSALEPNAQSSVTGDAFDVTECASGSGLRLKYVLPEPVQELTFIKSNKGSITGTLTGQYGKLVVSRAD